jgi:sugar phosphate isomerase/epimerase
MRKILPSMHFLENFMPLMTNEKYAVQLLHQAAEIPFYQAVELGYIRDAACRREIKRIVTERHWQLTQWCSPVIADQGLALSSLDKVERRKAVDLAIRMLEGVAECGGVRCGLQSGPDVGVDQREEAKQALTESCLEISRAAEQYPGLYLIIEPLDRYVHKKQLLGPIDETVAWFSQLKQACTNFYIHWDSAHEKLGGADLVKSVTLAAPYLAQFHICNCVTDPQHPYYGDHHMDVGQPPDYKTWGYLTPEVGAEILRTVAGFVPCEGIQNTYCALEVRCHLADDPWAKERLIRTFLQRTFALAGLPYEK